jgi:hypothetical protein
MPMESKMLAYRYNAPSAYTPRVAVIDLSPPPTAGSRDRYDWDAAQERAKRGIIPAAPRFPEHADTRYRSALEEVIRVAGSGNVRGLKTMEFKLYNNRWRLIARYRDLCLKALLRSNFQR